MFNDRDALENYIKGMKKYPALTQEEEFELFSKYRETGDKEYLNIIIEKSLRFCIHSVKKYKNCGVDFVDLIQEANLALFNAARTFDHTRGIRFVTHAKLHIRHNVVNYISKFRSPIKFMTTKNKRKIIQHINNINCNDYSDTNITNISKKLEIPKNDVSEFLKWNKSEFVSISEFVDSTSEEYCIPSYEKYDQEIYETQVNKKLKDALVKLNPRRYEIIKARYLNEHPTLFKDLAEEQGCSLQRIKQVEKDALKQLKGLLDGIN